MEGGIRDWGRLEISRLSEWRWDWLDKKSEGGVNDFPSRHLKLNSRKQWLRKYRSLKKVLPKAGHPENVNKDWTSVTATDRGNLAERTFFLGEIFEVAGAWRQPSLVTRKQAVAGHPVQMAPSSSYPREEDWAFTVLVGERLWHFMLYYRRPVFRDDFGRHVGTLPAEEKQRLAAEFHAVLGSNL